MQPGYKVGRETDGPNTVFLSQIASHSSRFTFGKKWTSDHYIGR